VSDLERVENVEENSNNKQEVLNRIIAAGLNSLVGWTTNHSGLESPERKLLDAFAEQSFDRIIPCFDLLDPRIQLYVFKPHKEAFLEYMLQRRES